MLPQKGLLQISLNHFRPLAVSAPDENNHPHPPSVLVNLHAMARVHVSPLPRAIFHSYPKLCKIFLGYCDSADKRKCVKITVLTDEFAI